MRFSGNKWQAHGMLFIPGLEYLLSSLFKRKSSSRCKWKKPDYRFRFSAWWDGCSRPSPCGKLVSILKADGIAWQGCSGGSECTSRLCSAFSENDPVITPDYLCALSWWRAQALTCACQTACWQMWINPVSSSRSLHVWGWGLNASLGSGHLRCGAGDGGMKLWHSCGAQTGIRAS